MDHFKRSVSPDSDYSSDIEWPESQLEVDHDTERTELVAPALKLPLTSVLISIATAMTTIVYYLYFICCALQHTLKIH